MQEMTMVINQDIGHLPPTPALEKVIISAEQLVEARLKLAMQLQQSLDPLHLLASFYRGLQTLIAVDGIKLELYNGPPDNTWLQGRHCLHSCSYRLNTGNELIGEIIFFRSKRFADAELDLLETFLCLLVFPLNNAVQYQKAVRMTLIDPLTGLGNRLALDHSLSRDLRLAQRYETPLSILMIDIDHFKSINDRFGHRCGDEVLTAVAHCLQQASRSSDACYRFGGEEFTVLLPATNVEGALIIAERIRLMIAGLRIVRKEGVVAPTISIGIASGDNSDGDNENELLDRADKALYLAKEGGRNRIQVADAASMHR